jgi:hypothetical protein
LKGIPRSIADKITPQLHKLIEIDKTGTARKHIYLLGKIRGALINYPKAKQ